MLKTTDAKGVKWVRDERPKANSDVTDVKFVKTELGTSLPTTDPAVAGALWVDTSAGYVIKVSQG